MCSRGKRVAFDGGDEEDAEAKGDAARASDVDMGGTLGGCCDAGAGGEVQLSHCGPGYVLLDCPKAEAGKLV